MKIRHLPRDLVRYLVHALSVPLRVGYLMSWAKDLEDRARVFDLAMLNIPILAENAQASLCQLKADSRFPLFNPSIVRLEDGRFLCLARSSNLVNYVEQDYRYEEDTHSTSNHVFILSEDLQIQSCEVLDDSPIRQRGSPAEGGLEDCRLFHHLGEIWGVGAAMSVRKGRFGNAQQMLFRLDGNKIAEHYYGPLPFGGWEKNWTPVECDDSIRLLYQLSPPVVLELKDHALTFVSGSPTRTTAWPLRGGTPLVKFGEHYLGIAHSDRYRVNDRIHYLHHLVVFDQSLRHIETSQPFFLRRRGIEFACGLQLSEGMAYISYGVADRAAEVMRIPVSALMHWLVADDY